MDSKVAVPRDDYGLHVCSPCYAQRSRAIELFLLLSSLYMETMTRTPLRSDGVRRNAHIACSNAALWNCWE